MKPHYYTYSNTPGYEAWQKHDTISDAIVASQKLAIKHPDRYIEILKCVASTHCTEPKTIWTCDNDQAVSVINDIKKKSPNANMLKFEKGDRVQVVDRGVRHSQKGTVTMSWISPNGYGEFDSVTMDIDKTECAFKADELEPLPHEYEVGDKVWITAGNHRGKVGKITRILSECVDPYDVQVDGITLDYSHAQLSPVEPSEP